MPYLAACPPCQLLIDNVEETLIYTTLYDIVFLDYQSKVSSTCYFLSLSFFPLPSLRCCSLVSLFCCSYHSSVCCFCSLADLRIPNKSFMGYMTCSPQALTTAKTQSQQKNFNRAMAHYSKARHAYWVSTLTATAKQFGWKKKRGRHY